MSERPLVWLYRGELVRVVDGDTADVRVTREIDFGFRMEHELSAVMRFRLLGVDTPEPRGATRELGLRATRFLESALAGARSLQVESHGEPDKYGGRWSATIHARGIDPGASADVWVDVAQYMRRLGFAREYHGKGARPGWDPTRPYPLDPLERDVVA